MLERLIVKDLSNQPLTFLIETSTDYNASGGRVVAGRYKNKRRLYSNL